MAGTVSNAFAVTSGGTVSDIIPAQAGILEQFIVGFFRQLERVALTNHRGTFGDPFSLTIFIPEDGNLYGARADIYACCRNHFSTP
jgi:hypothetical protein